MKRIIALLMGVFCLLSIFTGCSVPGVFEPEEARESAFIAPTQKATPTPEPTVEPTPTPTATPTPEPTPTEDPFIKLAPTITMSFEELVGDNGNYDMPKGYPKEDTYRIIVDLYHQVVMVYTKDEAGEYIIPVRYMLCSSGKNGTPTGVYKMDKHRVRFSQFVSDGRYGQYWSQIFKRIYFHTILYTKKDASSYIEEVYEKLGTPDSHGCVRLTAPDARWIFYNISYGTEVEIRKGSAEDLETAAIREKLVLASPPSEHVTIEKETLPDTDNWSIEEVPNEIKFIQGKAAYQPSPSPTQEADKEQETDQKDVEEDKQEESQPTKKKNSKKSEKKDQKTKQKKTESEE